MAALKDDQTMAELTDKFGVHANPITRWKSRFLDVAKGVFMTTIKKCEVQMTCLSIKNLQAKIEPLTLENDWRGRNHDC